MNLKKSLLIPILLIMFSFCVEAAITKPTVGTGCSGTIIADLYEANTNEYHIRPASTGGGTTHYLCDTANELTEGSGTTFAKTDGSIGHVIPPSETVSGYDELLQVDSSNPSYILTINEYTSQAAFDSSGDTLLIIVESVNGGLDWTYGGHVSQTGVWIAYSLSPTGGGGAAIPEFSTIGIIFALLIIAVGGHMIIKKNKLQKEIKK